MFTEREKKKEKNGEKKEKKKRKERKEENVLVLRTSPALGGLQIPKNKPRPGWAPDPPMVGIRSPIGLAVGSCTSHPGVLGSIPKREEPGKTGAPCVKVPD